MLTNTFKYDESTMMRVFSTYSGFSATNGLDAIAAWVAECRALHGNLDLSYTR